MIDPISGDEIPPIAPNADHNSLHRGNQGGYTGDLLYQESSSFYSWYQWIRKITDTDEGFHSLQVVMQIARKAGLTTQEEEHALTRLKKLREDLDDVVMTIDQIPAELKHIVEDLVENNPKNRVIQYATEIEMKLIQASATNEKMLKINRHLEQLMDKIASSYTPMQAEETSRELRDILNIENISEMQIELNQILQKHLGSIDI